MGEGDGPPKAILFRPGWWRIGRSARTHARTGRNWFRKPFAAVGLWWKSCRFESYSGSFMYG